MVTIVTIAFACFGAIIASFVGVMVERVHTGQSWQTGRSRCDSCARPLSPRDLVPILSWLFEQGKCRTCGARIGARHIVFEACLALLFALSYLSLGISLELVFFLLSLAVLAFIVAYDLKHTVVPAVASPFSLASQPPSRFFLREASRSLAARFLLQVRLVLPFSFFTLCRQEGRWGLETRLSRSPCPC